MDSEASFMKNSNHKDYNILIAVTGGIAAYKSVELASQLIKRGYNVKVMMTEAATEFVTPLTFETVTGNPVIYKMFSRTGDWDVEHISWAKWADLNIICPATANIIGKLASGICDDFVSTTLLASEKKCLIAPAMNTVMYQHNSVQDNLDKLKTWGYEIVEPGSGDLACGDKGKGRLASLEGILTEIENSLQKNNSVLDRDLTDQKYQEIVGKDASLLDKTVMITAGATTEMIDPVRYLTNPSSGKMGISLAEACLKKGAKVILICASTSALPPEGAELIQVDTAREMYEQVMANLDRVDLVFKTAAVSDYRPKETASTKLKKSDIEQEYSLTLIRNPDILAEVGKRKNGQLIVGFAAETDNIDINAKEKLKKKQLDMLVVNDVSSPQAGFAKDVNTVTVYFSDGTKKSFETMTKRALADELVAETLTLIEK